MKIIPEIIDKHVIIANANLVYPAPLINMIAPAMDGIIKIVQSAI